jgi:hypothetical protein
MKRSRAQKKAELLTEAEALIESLLDWDERTSKPHLRQIEDGDRGPRSEATSGSAAMSAVWRGDALQGSKGGEP